MERHEWSGAIGGRSDPEEPTTISIPIKPSPRGGSGTFLAADADGRQWWVKPLNNNQGPRVTVTESIVGAAGRLIGAPVCESAVVYLPAAIAGWEFRPGSRIEPGFAHASLAVDSAFEANQLVHRDRDDNARRHAGVFALYDWCWGGDDQWLYSETSDRELFSHDHGWYLPETGPTWNEASLAARVDEPHMPTWTVNALSTTELVQLSQALRTIERTTLAKMLSMVPASWPVSYSDLEAVGWFLERRSEAVATRLTGLMGGTV